MKITFLVKNDEGTEILIDKSLSQEQLERIAEKTTALTMLVDGEEVYAKEGFDFTDDQVAELVEAIGGIKIDFGLRTSTLDVFAEEDIGFSFAYAMKEAHPDLTAFRLKYDHDEDEDPEDEDLIDEESMLLLCGNFIPGGNYVLDHKGVTSRDEWYIQDHIVCLRPWFEESPKHENPFKEQAALAPKELIALAEMHAFAVRFACAKQLKEFRAEIAPPSP